MAVSLETVAALQEQHQAINEQHFVELKALVEKQNGAIGENRRRITDLELSVAGLKTWVALVGGGVGIVGLGAALLQALK